MSCPRAQRLLPTCSRGDFVCLNSLLYAWREAKKNTPTKTCCTVSCTTRYYFSRLAAEEAAKIFFEGFHCLVIIDDISPKVLERLSGFRERDGLRERFVL